MQQIEEIHYTYQYQYRKCGKVSCATCRDGEGHGPYTYAYWREGGKLLNKYLGKREANRIAVPHVREGNALTDEQWEMMKEECNYTCLCCKRREPDIHLHADHVIPKSKGGSHSIDNMQPLCQHCNARKGISVIDYRTLAQLRLFD